MSGTCSSKPYSIRLSYSYFFRPSRNHTRGCAGRTKSPPSIPVLRQYLPRQAKHSPAVKYTHRPHRAKAVRPPSGVRCPCLHPSSNDHLRNALPAQRLTRRKLLLLQPRERIKGRGNQKHDRSRDQARRVADDGEELDDAHDEIDGGAHVVCLEAADEGVEVLGCRADAQQERDFDEDEDEGGDAVRKEISWWAL
jgi:hypothetical protein